MRTTDRFMTVLHSMSMLATAAHRRAVAPYFRSEEKWKARGLLAAIVALNLGTVYMLVLQQRLEPRLLRRAAEQGPAGVLAQLGASPTSPSACIVIAVLKFYLTQLLQVRWRAWMTRSYLSRWLADHTFYRLELARYRAAAGG